MLGSLARLKVVTLDSLKKAIEEVFEGKIAEVNKKAVEIAYEELMEVSQVVT